MDKDHEVELARALMAGEPGAFEAFVNHFRAKLFHYVWMMCGHREDGEEVAQETLLKVFENFDQLREPERVRPWIFRIARNACLMKRRKSVFAPERELSLDELMPAIHDDGGHLHLEIADWRALPEEQLLRSEMKAALDRAIRELPETYRAAVLLRDVEELSTEETARILDISTDSVKQRLHRGRLAIRKTLDDYLRSAAPAPR